MKYISFANGSQVLQQGSYILDQKKAQPIFLGGARHAKKGILFHDSSKGTYVNENPKTFTKEAKAQRKLNNLIQ